MKFLLLVLVSIQTGKCGLRKQIIVCWWCLHLNVSHLSLSLYHGQSICGPLTGILHHPTGLCCTIPVLQILHSSDSLTCALGPACLPCGHKLIFFFFLVGLSPWGFQSFTDWSICWPVAQLVARHDCPFSSHPLLLDSLLPDSGFFSCLSVSLTSSALPSVGL